ncbi:unnamed protein product, partial [Iphiclides podalirius]
MDYGWGQCARAVHYWSHVPHPAFPGNVTATPATNQLPPLGRAVVAVELIKTGQTMTYRRVTDTRNAAAAPPAPVVPNLPKIHEGPLQF